MARFNRTYINRKVSMLKDFEIPQIVIDQIDFNQFYSETECNRVLRDLCRDWLCIYMTAIDMQTAVEELAIAVAERAEHATSCTA